MAFVDQELLQQLCEELRPFLDAELARGNTVVETWAGWPDRETLFIMLARPFKIQAVALPADVHLRELNDPHYWKAELVSDRTQHILGCRFG